MAEGQSNHDDLTSQSYWSNRWKRKKLKAYISDRKLPKILTDILQDVSRSRSSGTVCEIGCAPGTTLVKMAKAQPDLEYFGVDYSEAGIAIAHEMLQELGLQATLECEDYFKYSPSRLFDLVVSFGVIEHASCVVDAIRHHADFVRPGGLVVVSIPNWGSPIPKWMALRVDPTVFDSHNVTIMNPVALEEAMSQAGLSEVQVAQSGKPKLRTTCPHKTLQSMYWRTLAKLWNQIARILPLGVPWYTSLWAIGRKGSVSQDSADETLKATSEK